MISHAFYPKVLFNLSICNLAYRLPENNWIIKMYKLYHKFCLTSSEYDNVFEKTFKIIERTYHDIILSSKDRVNHILYKINFFKSKHIIIDN